MNTKLIDLYNRYNNDAITVIDLLDQLEQIGFDPTTELDRVFTKLTAFLTFFETLNSTKSGNKLPKLALKDFDTFTPEPDQDEVVEPEPEVIEEPEEPEEPALLPAKELLEGLINLTFYHEPVRLSTLSNYEPIGYELDYQNFIFDGCLHKMFYKTRMKTTANVDTNSMKRAYRTLRQATVLLNVLGYNLDKAKPILLDLVKKTIKLLAVSVPNSLLDKIDGSELTYLTGAEFDKLGAIDIITKFEIPEWPPIDNTNKLLVLPPDRKIGKSNSHPRVIEGKSPLSQQDKEALLDLTLPLLPLPNSELKETLRTECQVKVSRQ